MHFYAKTEAGVEPRHFVPMKTRPDELRPTRMSDVRAWWRAGETVYPSVTTIQNVLNKHGLNNWRVEQHISQAFGLNASEFDSCDAYMAECKRLAELEMDKAPTAGTDLHAKLESYALGEIDIDDPDFDICHQACCKVEDVTGCRVWEFTPEKRFTCDLGYGGCVDLSCDGGTPWVIDYKTKREACKFKPGKMAWPEHSQQLAAYRIGLGIPARCANVFICLETGEIDFHEHAEAELQSGWQIFSHSLAIWKVQNGYPLEQQEAA